MDDTLTKTASKANARYKAEIEKAMAEIRQHEATFDRLHAEIVAMQEAAERKDAQSAALTQEINRMMKVIWGPKNPMLNEIVAFIKSAASSYQRLTQAEEVIKKLQARADKHDDELRDSKSVLVEVLHEFDKDRTVAEGERKVALAERRTAERDYENLVLRLELAMKNDVRALPPGSPAPTTAGLEARIAALEREVKAHKGRIAALENAGGV